MNKSTNRTMRKLFAALFSLTVLATLAGWFLDKDPTQVTGLLTVLAAALGIGEASNIGRRITHDESRVPPS